MKRGFTLIEILIAIVFLAGAVLSLFNLQRISNQAAMDAYFETLSLQLAQEPIEIFRSFGYRWLEKYRNGIIPPLAPDLRLEEWCELGVRVGFANGPAYRPADADRFRRRISLRPVRSTGQSAALMIEVEVAPREESTARLWLTRNSIRLQYLLVEAQP